MKKNLEQYRPVVGDDLIDVIREEATPLLGKRIAHVNSTKTGGGVAEILNGICTLMNDVGITTDWRVIYGTTDFFKVTKNFHNSLQGYPIRLTKMKKRIWLDTNEENSMSLHLDDYDCIIVHDPQPLPLITFYKKKQPWIWRFHLDMSEMNGNAKKVWNFLEPYILKYDAMILTMESYKQGILIPQYVIPPSIDPLAPKNEEISDEKIREILQKFEIEQDKPIISQISRFDKLKDPAGVIEVFEKVREKVDCKLVMLGNMATDDPEGEHIYQNIIKKAEGFDDIRIISFTSDILVNALQRASSVVLQKSTKEGFALTVAEALWKKTPVVCSRRGGMILQVIDGENGYIVDDPYDYDAFADRIVRILENTEMAKDMGERGHEHVRKNFLTPRHLLDYIRVLNKVIG